MDTENSRLARRHERWALRRAVIGAALSVALAGCGESDRDAALARRTTSPNAVPANVKEAAAKALPSVNLSEFWQNVDRDGKTQSYEIRGSDANGKIREVRVSLDGKILEME
jgi:hypothetical protein